MLGLANVADEEESEEDNSDEEEEEESNASSTSVWAAAFLLSYRATTVTRPPASPIALGSHSHSRFPRDSSEYIGSCSDDGSVVLINSLFAEERFKFEYHRPMKAISLDPEYMRKPSRGFVTGGLAGHLYYNVKKWIGYRDQVLHSSEGPIHSVKWRNNLIAWDNDILTHTLHFILDDNLLVIGWGTSIKIISIRNNQNKGANVTYNYLQMSSLDKVDVVAPFQTSYYISVIAPLGDSLVVLAYIPVEEDREDFSSAVPSRQFNDFQLPFSTTSPPVLPLQCFLLFPHIKSSSPNKPLTSCCRDISGYGMISSHDALELRNVKHMMLYADYDPKMLLPFLRSSQHYTLERAHEICVRRGLLKEQVFILGRMGNAKQALTVIINKLGGDIEEAIELVSNQHDDDLWEELIKQCMNKPDMVGVLLEQTVGNLDPLYWRYIGCEDRLVKIITDHRTETSLRHGCNDILKADCVNLLIKCYKEARRAIDLGNEEDESHNKSNKKDRGFSASQEICQRQDHGGQVK
ncbi:hypothetical protein SASPL_101013 [Salvia splendens]|uniref:Vps41 beta-propeller domain-containing protein n=1 Tax=Salvia splendens TaxID=180675 RepID=A0A8X8YQ58_SALSN|nr:hypothetical protein SASPL_101013 [Salvia splendens]